MFFFFCVCGINIILALSCLGVSGDIVGYGSLLR